MARVYFGLATNGGTRALYAAAPTREATDEFINKRFAEPVAEDANDLLYAYEASRDYDPSPGLERIQAALLAINSADDERNPAELGILEREIRRVKRGRYLMIPASEKTSGHGTETGRSRTTR